MQPHQSYATKIYTLGYTGWKTDQLKQQVELVDAFLVDVRKSARSRVVSWNFEPLRILLGQRYVWMPTFGNRNYKTGKPIELVHPQRGLEQIRPLLAERPVILMCACANVQTCHRLVVAQMVAEVYHLNIEHLKPIGAIAR